MCLANTAVVASSSIQAGATTNESILTPVMNLEGHEPWTVSLLNGKQHEYKHVSYISYFPDSKKMISRSSDKTIRRWDLRKGKEIKEARAVYECVQAVGLSRDGRWFVAAQAGETLKAIEPETGIERTFHDGNWIDCIDISADSTLVAGGSYNCKVRIWNLDTGELVAGPFKPSGGLVEAIRFSEDSRKLAILSHLNERYLQVWDVQTQKLDVQKSTHYVLGSNFPVFWTTNDKSIVTAFALTDDDPTMIYECDASTLKTVGAPFKGHTSTISCLALSSDCVFLASSSYRAIKLWAFESRQLLASFNVKSPITLVLSPDSRQLACTCMDDTKIHIYDIPANILTSIESTSNLQI